MVKCIPRTFLDDQETHYITITIETIRKTNKIDTQKSIRKRMKHFCKYLKEKQQTIILLVI